jgi:2-aminoadipate transaminase
VDSVSFARRAASLASALPSSPPDGTIAFDSGHAFPGVLPDLSAEADRALGRYRAETLQYGPRPGLPGLRQWIAEYLVADGATVTADEILAVNGAKHGLELVCRMLLDEGDSVVVTAPTYFSAIPIIRSFGASFVEIPQDRWGLEVGQLAEVLEQSKRDGRPLPKFIYDVPDFHNPTGVTMSSDRRIALVELAARHRIPLVEDSPYRKVRFEGSSMPTLKALGGAGVIQLGSFAKLMAPGLRVGWVAAATPLIARMAMLKTDAGSSPLNQRIVLEFCAGGKLPAHTERVQTTYRTNRDRMLAALRRDLPEATTRVPQGGYYFWLALPDGVDGKAVTREAAANGVTIIAGNRFYGNPNAGHPRNRVRLAYSHATGEEIDEGVRRVARALRTVSEARSVAAGSAEPA